MGVTTIEWTDRSCNPLRALNIKTGAMGHYCEKVSSGCAHCYASGFQKRFGLPEFPGKSRLAKLPVINKEGRVPITDEIEIFLDQSKLDEVMRTRKPSRWFWLDMSDLFGSWVPDEWIDKIMCVMAATSRQTHQVLTKRPDRMLRYFKEWSDGIDGRDARCEVWLDRMCMSVASGNIESDCDISRPWPLPNLWLGTSCENQATFDQRSPLLNDTPAAVRFLSLEPLLGPIDISPFLESYTNRWVIVGGESGFIARPCNVQWIRSIVQQCKSYGVPCFVKQLGARPIDEVTKSAAELMFPNGVPAGVQVGGGYHRRAELSLSHKKGGDPKEWPADLNVREFPNVSVS